MDWVIIVAAVLLLFGGRKLPQLAKDLGSGIREFRQALMNPQNTQQVIEQRPAQIAADDEEEVVPKKKVARKPAKRSKAKA